MALMTQNTNGTTIVHPMNVAQDVGARNVTNNDAHHHENITKKRKNGITASPSGIEAVLHDKEKAMDVDELRPTQKNHDPINEENDLLLH